MENKYLVYFVGVEKPIVVDENIVNAIMKDLEKTWARDKSVNRLVDVWENGLVRMIDIINIRAIVRK